MADTDPASKRRYRGMDGSERAQVRRAKLIEAGLDLFGTAGYATSTIDDVCQEAGLAKRYFYESFSDREALLVAVYDREIERAQEVVVLALSQTGPTIEEQVAAGLSAFIRYFAADRRRSRLVFVEIIRAGEGVEDRYRQARHQFRDFIITMLTQTLDIPRTARIELGTTILVGGVVEVMWEWVRGDLNTTVDELIDVSILMFNLLYQQYLRELAEGRSPGA